MVSRRRLLLSYLANSFKYLPYSYEYLYYGLVPTTIDSKQVRNKVKVSKLYGNSVVENQLQKTTSTTYFNGNSGAQNFSTLADVNGVLTQTYHSTPSLNYQSGIISTSSNNRFDSYISHKYLIRFKFRANINTNVRAYIEQAGYTKYFSINANTWYECADILSATGNKTANYVMIVVEDATTLVAGNVLEFAEVQCIDLTQRYPFNTPTTLTDNRVQAIFNGGYIPFNLGELKSVDIGEISSKPYNLFDEELEGGFIDVNNGTNYEQNDSYRSKDFIQVVGGKQYTLSRKNGTNGTTRVYEYDDNYNFISNTSILTGSNETGDITLSTQTKYVKIACYLSGSGYGTNPPTNNNIEWCFHRTGTRTGYAPYQAPQTIPFKYQGSGVGTAHDTYELTKTAYVFTKNNRLLDLSQVSGWYYDNTLQWGTNKIENYTADNSTAKEILSEKYTSIRFNGYASSNDNNLISFRDNGYVYVKNGNQTTQPSGFLLYQLATPQVITIPRKHLAVVDLGTLSWTKTGNHFYSSDLASLIKMPSDNYQVSNLYCLKYISGQFNLVYNETLNNAIGVQATPSGSAGYIHINDSSKSSLSATDFKNAMSGILLFYETQDEVADITDTFDIQSGGTINTDSNVLPNADFLMKCK